MKPAVKRAAWAVMLTGLFGVAGLNVLLKNSPPSLKTDDGIKLLFGLWPAGALCLMVGTWLIGATFVVIGLGPRAWRRRKLLAQLLLSSGIFLFGLGVVERVVISQLDRFKLNPRIRAMLAQSWDPEIGRFIKPSTVPKSIELPPHGGNCDEFRKPPQGCWKSQTCLTLFSTDALGFNNRLQPANPAMLFLGDSFTEGFHVPLGDGWVARFAQHSGLPVWNLGVGGYGIAQEYLLFERFGLDTTSPVVVLAVLTENDLFDQNRWFWWRRSGEAYPEWLRRQVYKGMPASWLAIYDVTASWVKKPAPALDPVTVKSGQSLCEVGYHISTFETWCQYACDDNANTREEFHSTMEWLERLAGCCRLQGRQLVVLLLCGKLDVYPPANPLSPAWQQLLIKKGLLPAGADETKVLLATQKLLAVGDRLEAWYRSACQLIGIPCHAARYALRQAAEASDTLLFYAFDTHINSAGNRVIAEDFYAWWQAGFPDNPENVN